VIDRNRVRVASNAQRTSILAAEKALPRSGTKRRRVYDYIVNRGLHGATDDEIQDALGIDGNTVRPTRGGLVEDGHIIDTGTTRKNKHHNKIMGQPTYTHGALIGHDLNIKGIP
jgi:transcription initiation factor IIE alpha subunit